MELEKFIENFRDQLEDESVALNGETKFKELNDWDSLTAMLVVGMYKTEYDKDITATEIVDCDTILDLFNQINA